MVRLRRVDAEQSDRLVGRAGTAHDDRVAVEHLHDAVRGVGRAPLVTEPPPQPDAPSTEVAARVTTTTARERTMTAR